MLMYMSSESFFARKMSSDLKDYTLSKGAKSMFIVWTREFVLLDSHRQVFRQVHGEGA